MARKKRIQDDQIREQGDTNAIYEAYKNEFEAIFADNRDNITYGEECDWYVGKRWDPHMTLKANRARDAFYHEAMFHKLFTTKIPNNAIRVILVHGGTGYGKSTFIQHYFRSWFPINYPDIALKVYYIRINLYGFFDPDTVKNDLETRIETRIHQLFFHLFETPEYKNFMKERRLFIPHSHSSELLYKIHFLCENKQYHLVFFYDNIDQESHVIQRRIFALARSFITQIECREFCTTIMAVREYFYRLAKTEVPERAYGTKPFRVDPPDIDELLLARANLLHHIIGNNKVFKVKNKQNEITNEITINEPYLFLLFIIKCFTSNKRLSLFLYKITGNNVRQQINLIENMIKSPRIKKADVLDYLHHFLYDYAESLDYILKDPLNRLKVSNLLLDPAIMTRYLLSHSYDANIYSKDECPLINIFDIGEPLQSCNTLLLYNVLSLFNFRSRWEVGEIIDIVTKMGAYPLLVKDAIQTLLDTNLTSSKEGYRLKGDNITTLDRTDPGMVFLDECICTLSYMETMAYRTPLDDKYYKFLPASPLSSKDEIFGAAVLYRQIVDDERIEDNYLETVSKEPDIKQKLGREKPLSEKILPSILEELGQIHTIVENDEIRKKCTSWFAADKPLEK